MTSKYHFFYDGIFSNFYPASFLTEGQRFETSEQYFMYCKAMTFLDEESAKKILATSNPGTAKALGRKVKNFDAKTWSDVCYSIMYRACYLKFTQNPGLLNSLLAMQEYELVEASPTDRIWGIGLSTCDPKRFDRSQWRGENLLGKVLNELRDKIIRGNIQQLKQITINLKEVV